MDAAARTVVMATWRHFDSWAKEVDRAYEPSYPATARIGRAFGRKYKPYT